MLKRMILLALLTISLAGAKTFKFTLPEIAHAGDVKLKPGEYTLEVNGSKVGLRDKAGHPIAVAAKLETADFELSFTAVCLTREDGITRIQYIYLESRRHRVVFE